MNLSSPALWSAVNEGWEKQRGRRCEHYTITPVEPRSWDIPPSKRQLHVFSLLIQPSPLLEHSTEGVSKGGCSTFIAELEF